MCYPSLEVKVVWENYRSIFNEEIFSILLGVKYFFVSETLHFYKK